MSVKTDFNPVPSNQSIANGYKDQGNTCYKQGLYQKSVELYTKALEADPTNPSLYNNRSAAYLMLNNYRQAHQDAHKSVSLDHSNIKSLLRLAKCCLCLGDLDEAKRLSAIVRESEPSSPELISLNEKLELLSQTYLMYEKQLAQSDLSHALHLITKCINFAPGSLDYNLKRLHLLLSVKRFTEAKHYVETLLKCNDACVDLLFYRGLCLYYLDHLDKAITHFQHVLRLHPDHVDTQKAFKRAKNLARLKEQGNAFIHARQFTNAYDAYTEALQLDPLHDAINAKLYCNRACAAFNLNRFEDSLKDCDAALQLDPGYLKAHTRRAKCYSALELYEKAVQEWNSIVQMDPSSEHKRNLRSAEAALQRSKQLDYYKVLGLRKNASFDEIKQAYKKNALRYHPDRHTDADEATRQEQERKFKEVGEAYSVLSDPQKRRQYDSGELGPCANFGAGGQSAENIFTEVFQGFGTSTVHFCFG